jgi:hypothetical protein
VITKQRRILNLQLHLSAIKIGTPVTLGVTEPQRFTGILTRAGFTQALVPGEAVLPAAVFGPVSRYNAGGRYLVHRELPMETAYRTVEWHWSEWHGEDRVEKTDWVDVSYKRYPRDFVPPPSVELHIGTSIDGAKVVFSAAVNFTADNAGLLQHTINLYLEMFGECSVLTEELEAAIIKAPVRRLNWTVLPPGRMPWEQLRTHLQPLIQRARKGNQPVIAHRLETINGYGPEFTAVGHGGFDGYVIFGFPERNLYICESRYSGNATYVFGQDWETLSQMTKADILSESLQEARLIHRAGWEAHLRRVM